MFITLYHIKVIIQGIQPCCLQEDHLPLAGGRDFPRGHSGEGRIFDPRKRDLTDHRKKQFNAKMTLVIL